MELYLEPAGSDDYAYNWDIAVNSKGEALVVTEDKEIEQKVNFLVFLVQGAIPLMEEYGVDWSGWLFKEITLVQLNSQITEIIREYLGDNIGYYPNYNEKDGKLIVTMARIIMQGE